MKKTTTQSDAVVLCIHSCVTLMFESDVMIENSAIKQCFDEWVPVLFAHHCGCESHDIHSCQRFHTIPLIVGDDNVPRKVALGQ